MGLSLSECYEFCLAKEECNEFFCRDPGDGECLYVIGDCTAPYTASPYYFTYQIGDNGENHNDGMHQLIAENSYCDAGHVELSYH